MDRVENMDKDKDRDRDGQGDKMPKSDGYFRPGPHKEEALRFSKKT